MNEKIFMFILNIYWIGLCVIIGYSIIDKIIKYSKKNKVEQKDIKLFYKINKITLLQVNSINYLISILLYDKLKDKTINEASEIVNRMKNNLLELTKDTLDNYTENLKNEIIENKILRKIIANYFILKNIIYKNLDNTNESHYILAKIYDSNIEKITRLNEIDRIKKEVLIQCKSYKKEYNELVKRHIDETKNEKYGKIKIEFSQINELIKIVPILLFVGGFFTIIFYSKI